MQVGLINISYSYETSLSDSKKKHLTTEISQNCKLKYA